jgi:fatty acid desaturase
MALAMGGMWRQLDAAIAGFFNPLALDPAVRAPVRNNWPLHRLDHAVYLAASYVVFVVVCKLTRGSAAKATASNEKKVRLSVADKVKQDGIIVFSAMAIYNAVQVALCGWMVYAALAEHQRRGLKLACNAHNLAEDGMAFVLYVFYLSKVLDFADTVFMIVKNNWRQVSFLHVYHHSSIFLVYWLNANVSYDADIYFTVVLNGAIHFIMYGYYLATAFNVAVPVFIKKSITNAQLVQFCCMEGQGLYMLLGGCPFPRNVTFLYMAYIATMLALFLDFKRRTYGDSKRSKATKRPIDENSNAENQVMFRCGFVPNKKRKVSQTQSSEKVMDTSDVIMENVAIDSPHQSNEMYIGGRLYNVGKFKHPGGTIIKFYQGSGDATATVEQFHMRSKKFHKVLASLPSRPSPCDASPAMDKQELAKDFLRLTADLKAEGFFTPHLGAVVFRISELVLLNAVGFYLMICYNSLPLRALGLITVAIAEGRAGWLMHEGGHGSLTGDIKTDRTLQIYIYGVGCGMSAGWWRSQHNRHHAAPQKLKHDADLDTLPLVAFHSAVAAGVRSPVIRKWLQAQAYMFMPFTCFLVVLGWQLFLHPRYIIRTSKWSEAFALLIRYYGTFAYLFSSFSWPAAIGCYLLIQALGGAYIFTNFAMSHTHLPVTQPDEHVHWCEYASSHTTNLSNHWFVNWWMAYLNFQIEHHLFPTMPQFRHPQTSIRVQAFFRKHSLTYDVRGYFACLGDTLKNLHEVGNYSEAPKDK